MEVLSVELGKGFNVLCAPLDVLEKSINCVRNCSSSILYVHGAGQPIIGEFERYLHVSRAYTLCQLTQILLEAYEDVILIEHHPSFYDTNFATFEDFIMLLKRLGKEKTIIYLSSKRDRVFDFIAGLGDRYVYVEEDVNGYYLADVSERGVKQSFHPKESEEQLPILV